VTRAWRVDVVERSDSGAILQVQQGEPFFTYEHACYVFDEAFKSSDSNQSVRLMRAREDLSSLRTLDWIVMREAWAGET